MLKRVSVRVLQETDNLAYARDIDLDGRKKKVYSPCIKILSINLILAKSFTVY